MTELEAGEGHNDGPELRLLVQSARVDDPTDRLTDLPTALASLSPAQQAIFAKYRRGFTDFEPLGRRDGYRFNDEWTFPMLEVS